VTRFADLSATRLQNYCANDGLGDNSFDSNHTIISGTSMRFRLKAFGLHLLGSAVVLSLIFGSLYFGWYRWPGWYLADVSHVVLVMAAVDIVVGPLLTFVVANGTKPRRELKRDIAVIVAIQLFALIYGSISLWNGRPLYYAFSENVIQVVQAYDINPQDLVTANKQNNPLVPHWYSLPRRIWAPLPQDSATQNKIVASAVAGGDDVISMPQYYQPWVAGLPALRAQLKKVDDLKFYSTSDKAILKKEMGAAGIAQDAANSIPLTGRGKPLLAVIDATSGEIAGIFKGK
jgi:hypothetical protein